MAGNQAGGVFLITCLLVLAGQVDGDAGDPRRPAISTLSNRVRASRRPSAHDGHHHSKEGHAAGVERVFQWGAWGEASTCTRTCGAGVRYRKRHCYKSSNEITYVTAASLCGGGTDRRYDLCNTQACPEGVEDFRAHQCSAHNRKLYRGRYYHWKPYQSDAHRAQIFQQCALVCTTAEHNKIAVKFADQVLDGTSCTAHSNIRGVCIDRKCVPIGCDGRLYSTLATDECGVCGGDGTSCIPITGSLQENITLGYNTLLTIPEQARHIKIVELGGSSSVFALRNEKNIYFVGGMHMATHPTVYEGIGGSTFYYHHPLYEANRREKVKAEGPTNETLYVMMLCPEPQTHVSLHYEYTIPRADVLVSTPTPMLATTQEQRWETQRRFLPDIKYEENILSWRDSYGRVHNYGYGNQLKKTHDTTTPSNTERSQSRKTTLSDKYTSAPDSVPTAWPGSGRHLPPYGLDAKLSFHWKTSAKAACSSTCTPGVQSAYAQCYRNDNVIVDDALCDMSEKPEPTNVVCEGRPCKPRWVSSMWSQCSVSCGEGRRFRAVRCWRMMGSGLDSTVHQRMCKNQEKPLDVTPCQAIDCGPLWQTSEWKECSSLCEEGIQKRVIRCSSPDGDCDRQFKPESIRKCNEGPCDNRWDFGEWTECSGPCGKGVVRRSVACRDQNDHILHDKYCEQTTRPLSTQACGDRPDCAAAWVPQDWGVCSVECGEGFTMRHVPCGQVNNGVFRPRPNSYCRHKHKPATRGRCRELSCPAMWYTTRWSECSKTCGDGGSRVRRVDCYQDDAPALTCDHDQKPYVRERCLLPPCKEAIDIECVDDGKTNCRLVVQFGLCGHWHYRAACCRTCSRARNSTPRRDYNSVSASHAEPTSDSKH